ncbi:MAG TPA: DsbA family protein [archaeon]|nr:DsbA family protein [archaeon]
MMKFLAAGFVILVVGLIWLFFFSVPPYTPSEIRGNILGAESGEVEIVMYSDFLCPACKAADPIVKKILEDYPNSTKLVYKHMVIHDAAMPLAIAVECAGDQGKFWEMHDKIFENQNRAEYMNMADLAETLGMDKGNFSACMRSGAGAMRQRIAEDMKEARAAGVKATPSFVINGKFREGLISYSDMKSMTEQIMG